MSIFSKLFGKKQAEENEVPRVGGMEDFMTLIRVYIIVAETLHNSSRNTA